MKLDNRGWGTKEMIIMSSILFFLLLVVTVMIYSFYNNKGNNAYTYSGLESTLRSAAIRYANDNNILIGEITVSQLKQEGYLTSFKDDKGRDCSGYVELQNGQASAHINCPDYRTLNY